MCGRYEIRTTPETIRDYFSVPKTDLILERYNIAPSQHIPIVRNSGSQREIIEAVWGLVPFWSKGPDSKYSMINARVETAAKKPAYRKPVKSQRCLIPATGYYEWKTENGKKQPYHIHDKDDRLFAFAGLWDHWEDEEKAITSATIMTSEAMKEIEWLHPRMPIILEPEYYDDWLNPDVKFDDVFEYLGSTNAISYSFDKVSTYVSSPKNNTEKCIEPITKTKT